MVKKPNLTIGKCVVLSEFWKRYVATESGCWEWTAGRYRRGYGVVGKHGYAHRVAWELTHGVTLRTDEEVCHRCDNPPCINPSHLFLGTHEDNLRDARKKGHTVVGGVKLEGHRGLRLGPEDVRAIRVRLASGELPSRIVPDYGVSLTTICRIRQGHTWRWLDAQQAEVA